MLEAWKGQAVDNINERSFIDFENCSYQEWVYEFGYRYYGMRDKDNGEVNGVVRFICLTSGAIMEATFRDGYMHGLHRSIRHDCIRYMLYKDGQFKATVTFGYDGKEIDRSKDPHGYLKDLKQNLV